MTKSGFGMTEEEGRNDKEEAGMTEKRAGDSVVS